MRAHVIVLFALAGCGNASEERAKLAELQQKADQKLAKAEQDAAQKLRDVQSQADQCKSELADTKAKLDEASNKAQASSDEQSKAAEAALAKARQAFKEEGRLELADLNKELTELSGKAAKAPAAAKTAFGKSMQQVVTQQKAITKDLSEFDGASLEALSTVKAKLKKDLATLKATLRGARAKLPSS